MLGTSDLDCDHADLMRLDTHIRTEGGKCDPYWATAVLLASVLIALFAWFSSGPVFLQVLCLFLDGWMFVEILSCLIVQKEIEGTITISEPESLVLPEEVPLYLRRRNGRERLIGFALTAMDGEGSAELTFSYAREELLPKRTRLLLHSARFAPALWSEHEAGDLLFLFGIVIEEVAE